MKRTLFLLLSMMILTSCVSNSTVVSDYCLVHKQIKLSETTLTWLELNKENLGVRQDIKQLASDSRVHKELCHE